MLKIFLEIKLSSNLFYGVPKNFGENDTFMNLVGVFNWLFCHPHGCYLDKISCWFLTKLRCKLEKIKQTTKNKDPKVFNSGSKISKFKKLYDNVVH